MGKHHATKPKKTKNRYNWNEDDEYWDDDDTWVEYEDDGEDDDQ